MNSMIKKLPGILLIGGVLCADVVLAADVDWEGWSFDYSTRENSSGLVLKDVVFNGKQILGKASMPVMRVQYDGDRCGPYADILNSQALETANAGAPNSACDGQSVCRRTFRQNGENMLEIGSNWQIGEYQIYQTYYFSEQGYIDSRVYSRGLQCRVNHRHHAHWMFDFDIGDPENDQISRGADNVQSVEFNDLASRTSFWTIKDTVSGDSVRLIPSDDDGSPDSFSEWDVAGRKFESAETGRWRLGARGEIGKKYISPAENIDGKDIVLWYVSHLPHASSEGSSIWHASGPRIEVDVEPVAPPPPPPPSPGPDETNLLVNGGFESDIAGWTSCGSANNLTMNDDAREGSKALTVNGGGCIYQEVPVTPGEEYTFTCDAKRAGSQWSIVELAYIDSGYSSLDTQVKQIVTAGEYSSYALSGAAPASAAYAVALLYSEDNTSFDKCVLSGGAEPPGPPPPVDPDANILANGGFETGLNSWFSCAQSNLSSVVQDGADTGAAALQVTGGGCMYQEFEATPGSSYSMNCRARRNTTLQYTSVSLSLLNANYNSLEGSEVPVRAVAYADYAATLTAPAGSKYGTVVVYSEDTAVFDTCTVTKI